MPARPRETTFRTRHAGGVGQTRARAYRRADTGGRMAGIVHASTGGARVRITEGRAPATLATAAASASTRAMWLNPRPGAIAPPRQLMVTSGFSACRLRPHNSRRAARRLTPRRAAAAPRPCRQRSCTRLRSRGRCRRRCLRVRRPLRQRLRVRRPLLQRLRRRAPVAAGVAPPVAARASTAARWGTSRASARAPRWVARRAAAVATARRQRRRRQRAGVAAAAAAAPAARATIAASLAT